MSKSDLTAFQQNIVRSKLLTDAELVALHKSAHQENAATCAEAFLIWLVAHGKLTHFQADSLLRGNTRFCLDDYTVVDRIGTGRMAGVYEATHKRGVRVAIKILPPSLAKQPELLSRFQREAQLALQLNHPHIVRTYHAGVSDGLHYIAMELLDGETLEELLSTRGKLPPVEAVRIVHQALLGMQCVHQAGMVHRDLKPGNVMLVLLPGSPPQGGPPYTVKLLDIGLGRALFDESGVPLADLTSAGDMIGTPDYMSPEQGQDSHAADIRSDIYSLGCVLYHCLSGRVPFSDKNPVVKLIKHVKEMPPPLNLGTYPRANYLHDVLWRMIDKDPAMRYPTPADAAKDLEPLLSPSVAPVPPIATAAPSVAATPFAEVALIQAPMRSSNSKLRSVLIWIAIVMIVAAAIALGVVIK